MSIRTEVKNASLGVGGGGGGSGGGLGGGGGSGGGLSRALGCKRAKRSRR